jgi:putative membrane protein
VINIFRKATTQAVLAGMLAGALGGFVGSFSKIGGEVVYPPRPYARISPPALLAEHIVGHPLAPAQASVVSAAVHFGFGTVIGAVYGIAGEFAPIVRVGFGTGFGLVLQIMTHETLVPLAGLDQPPLQQPFRDHASEILTHLLYGLTVEAIRRMIRAKIKTKIKTKIRVRGSNLQPAL